MDNLNNIPNAGNWGDAASKLNDNFNKIKQSLTTVENTSKNNKGYFTSLSALNTAFPSPKAGQTAYVYDEASSTKYYIYNAVNGAWVTSSIEAPSVGVDIAEYTKTGGSTKTTKDIDDNLTQLEGNLNKNILDLNALGLAPTSISDAINKAYVYRRDGIILKVRTTTNNTYLHYFRAKSIDTLNDDWYNQTECWTDLVVTNVGMYNLSQRPFANWKTFESKQEARDTLPSDLRTKGVKISYLVGNYFYEETLINTSQFSSDDGWLDIYKLNYNSRIWDDLELINRSPTYRRTTKAIKDIWLDKSKIDSDVVIFNSINQDKEIPTGDFHNSSITLKWNDVSRYFGFTRAHKLGVYDIYELKISGEVYGYAAIDWETVAGYNAYNTLEIKLSENVFNVDNTTILKETVKKHLLPESNDEEDFVSISDSRYSMIEAKGLVVENSDAKTIQYYLNGIMHYEPFNTSKQFDGRLAFVRLFNFELPILEQTDLLRMMPSDKLGSEFYGNDLDVSGGMGLAITGASKHKWAQMEITVRENIKPEIKIWRVRAVLANGTELQLIPYGNMPVDAAGKTYEVPFKVGDSEVVSIDVAHYSAEHSYIAQSASLRYKEVGVISAYMPNSIEDKQWLDIVHESRFLDISDYKKYAKTNTFSNINDAYLYGIDKNINVGGVSYCKSGNSGDVSDLTQINPNRQVLVGKLQPVDVIELDKRYLGCWVNKHYAVDDSTKIIYSSIDGEEWDILWDTQNLYGKVWHLVANDSGRVIVATQGAANRADGLFVSDVNGENFTKKFEWTSSPGSTVSTYQDIQIHGNIVLLNEYDSGTYASTSGGGRTGAKVWMSKDYGETFKVIFDGHKHDRVTSVPDSAGYNHVHGAFYDKYWDRVWVACGDKELSGLLWSDSYWDRTGDETDTYSDYKFVRYRVADGDTIHKAKGIPQPIAGFAMPNAVFFGTDAYPNGIFATFRDSKDNPTFQRVLKIGEDKDTITVIPQPYHQSRDGRPCYVGSGLGSNSTELYNSIYATFDGINFEKVWEDNILRDTAGVTITGEIAYCYDDDFGNTWVYTKGYNEVSRKLIRCRQL